MTDTKALDDRIEASGLKKSAIIERLGLKTYQSFRNKATNVTEFTASELAGLKDLLGLSDEDFKAIFLRSE